MNDERLEIARRLVMCPKWVWLPGMLATGDVITPHLPVRVGLTGDGGLLFYDRGIKSKRSHRRAFCDFGLFPDLDDDLTRLGVLAVVRRAWNDPTASIRFIDRCPLDSSWECNGRWVCYGPTEEAALLAALEAAP